MNNNMMIDILKNSYTPKQFSEEVAAAAAKIRGIGLKAAKRGTADDALMDDWFETIASLTVSVDLMKACPGLASRIGELRKAELKKRCAEMKAVVEHGTASIKPGAVKKVLSGNHKFKHFIEKSNKQEKGKL